MAIALLATAACSPGTSAVDDAARDRAEQLRSVAEEAGLAADVADFIERLGGGVAATYDATLETSSADGTTTVVRVVQDPPRRRIEVMGERGPTLVTVEDEGEVVVCDEPPEWRCRVTDADLSSGAAFDPEAVAATATALAEAADLYAYRIEAGEVAGAAVDCLVADPAEGVPPEQAQPARLCATQSGVVLQVERPSSVLRATRWSTSVPADAFDPPAEVDG